MEGTLLRGDLHEPCLVCRGCIASAAIVALDEALKEERLDKLNELRSEVLEEK